MQYTHTFHISTNTNTRRLRFRTAAERASTFRALRAAGWRGRMVHGQGLTLFHPETHDRVFGSR